jgi:VWFA-related protein
MIIASSVFRPNSAFAQVSVPAVVRNSAGGAVHGLAKTDFAVTSGENASFDSVEEVPALNFATFSDPTPVFILFDANSIAPPVQGEVEKQLLAYLRKAADEHLAVTVLVNSDRGLALVHDMSTDPKVFSAAMDRVMTKSKEKQSGSPSPQGNDESAKAIAQEIEQLQLLTKLISYSAFYKSTQRDRLSPLEEDDTRRALEKQELESLRQVGQIFRRSRKRKLLIWLTGYFPIDVANRELTYGNYSMPYRARPKIRPDMTPVYQIAVNSLNDSRLSVFPVFVPDASIPDVRVYAKDTVDGLGELAQRTGGRMLGIMNEIDFFNTTAGLRKDFDSYYILSFSLHSAHKDSWIDDTIKA